MPSRQDLIKFSRYYLRVFRQIIKDLWKFGREQVIIAVLASLLILYLQIRWGMIPNQLTLSAFLSIAYPYLWIVGAAFVLHTIRAPFVLDKERQAEIDILNAQNAEMKDASSERDKLAQRNQELESKLQSIQSEKSRQDNEIEELNSKIEELRMQKTRKVRRRYIREQLGGFLDEGKDISWDMKIAVPEAYQKYKLWLERVKQFLTQEDEFDSSYLARFNANPIGVLEEFIKEFMD